MGLRAALKAVYFSGESPAPGIGVVSESDLAKYWILHKNTMKNGYFWSLE